MKDVNRREAQADKFSTALSMLSNGQGYVECPVISLACFLADGREVLQVSAKREIALLCYGKMQSKAEAAFALSTQQGPIQTVVTADDGAFFTAFSLPSGDNGLRFSATSGDNRVRALTVVAIGKCRTYAPIQLFTVLRAPDLTLRYAYDTLWLCKDDAETEVGKATCFDGAMRGEKAAIVWADAAKLHLATYGSALSRLTHVTIDRPSVSSVALAPFGGGWLIVSVAANAARYDLFSSDTAKSESGSIVEAAGTERVLAVKDSSSPRFVFVRGGKAKTYAWQTEE